MAGSVTAHIPGRGDDGLHQIRSNNNHLSGILQKMLQEKIQLYVNCFGVCGTIMVWCDNLVFHLINGMTSFGFGVLDRKILYLLYE